MCTAVYKKQPPPQQTNKQTLQQSSNYVLQDYPTVAFISFVLLNKGECVDAETFTLQLISQLHGKYLIPSVQLFEPY